MRILLISNAYPPGYLGGYELAAHEFGSWLVESGHEVHVLTSDLFDDEIRQDLSKNIFRTLKNYVFSSTGTSPLSAEYGMTGSEENIKKLVRTIEHVEPDLILAFNLAGLGVTSFINAFRAVDLPTVLYMMDDYFKGIELTSTENEIDLVRSFLNSPKCVVVSMSANLLGQIEQSLACEIERPIFMPGWSEAVGHRPSKTTPSNTTPTRNFVFSSRITDNKGVLLVLQSAVKLKAMNKDFKIDFYGDGQTALLQSRIYKMGLQNHVEYKGNLSKTEMSSAFQHYEFLLFPTWPREPFGFVAAEAAAAGCVPVITSQAGAAEWFIDGIDSIKIENQLHDLSRAMQRICDLELQKVEELRVASRATADRFMSKQKIFPELESILGSFELAHKKTRKATPTQIISAIIRISKMGRKS